MGIKPGSNLNIGLKTYLKPALTFNGIAKVLLNQERTETLMKE
jgi:hypothetical protein